MVSCQEIRGSRPWPRTRTRWATVEVLGTGAEFARREPLQLAAEAPGIEALDTSDRWQKRAEDELLQLRAFLATGDEPPV